MGASLVVQWLRICLPTQGTWVRSLVRGGFHILWSNQAPVPQLLSLPTTEPATREATAMRSPHTTSERVVPTCCN